MRKNFSTLRPDILERWHHAANAAGIPREAYNPKVKIVRDPSGKSTYSFGVILNTYRFQRYEAIETDNEKCLMCEAIQETRDEPLINIDPNAELSGFVVRPNKFPIQEGASLAITRDIGDQHRKMYTTKTLDGLADEMTTLFTFGDETGFQVFHHSEGAGATIPNHEHWHLINSGALYTIAGEQFGFGDSDIEPLRKYSGIYIMPDFPFAHLIFNQDNPNRIVAFLHSLVNSIGNSFPNGIVPHGISQGQSGILVVPSRKYVKKGIGSGDMAGHVLCRTKAEFTRADYEYCINTLGQTLFTKQDIDLTQFL